MPLVLAGATSGQATVQATDAQTVTITLPATSGTLVTTGGAQTIEFADGSAAAPSITNSGDTNTGIFFPAADTIAFTEGGTEAMRLDSSGNVGIGTSSPANKLVVSGTGTVSSRTIATDTGGDAAFFATNNASSIAGPLVYGTTKAAYGALGSGESAFYSNVACTVMSENTLKFAAGGNTERMRIDTSGNLLVGQTTRNLTIVGFAIITAGSDQGQTNITTSGTEVMNLNRNTSDGELIRFRQDATIEGNISVSGTTVSYNGGHLARWSQLPDGSKDDTILKGTVLTNLDDMCVWVKDGEQLPNEQLNKMKVSDVEGDTNVAGVFVNWTMDEDCNSDDMNIAMTGDMIIRIANGVVVQKGDLLMSAGDGTAKPQGDDIVRSKTVAKVTSNYVTCTYEDGSYCVPCVLMAC